MTLLDFARGPGLQWSLIIFVLGVFWRIVGTFLMTRHKDYSAARDKNTLRGGIRTAIMRSFPSPTFKTAIGFHTVTGYLWHLGFFAVLLFYVPHIEFFKGIFGFSWPGLPSDVILIIAAITLATLIALLVRRINHPVLRVISNADDYISWLVTTAPLITGLMAFAHLGPRYETMLGIHILSVELLLVWFPFGKLMHLFFVFPSRYNVGATFRRRGVEV